MEQPSLPHAEEVDTHPKIVQFLQLLTTHYARELQQGCESHIEIVEALDYLSLSGHKDFAPLRQEIAEYDLSRKLMIRDLLSVVQTGELTITDQQLTSSSLEDEEGQTPPEDSIDPLAASA